MNQEVHAKGLISTSCCCVTVRQSQADNIYSCLGDLMVKFQTHMNFKIEVTKTRS